jgi:signal transduction histidine kinase/ActR/RegA family two-component response regulator
VLAGWLAGSQALVAIRPGLAAMAPVTAICFVVAGCSLGGRKVGRPRLATATASVVLLIGLFVLAGYLVAGRDVLNPLIGNRIDGVRGRLLGSTAPATATAFTLLGLCLLMLERPTRVRLQTLFIAAGGGALVSGVALLGYAYGVEGLYATAFYRSTALHTATGLFLMFVACFTHYPERGWTGILASSRPSGGATRMQLLLILLLPSCAGWFLLRELRAGVLAPSLVMALLVVSATVPMVIRIFLDGSRLDALDMQLRVAMGSEQELNAELEQRVEARTAALLKAEAELRQANKMEAVGQLTGGLAHDFNNLLTAIGGSLELMQLRLAQGHHDQLERYVLTAKNACRRAAALTHRLLAFARRQALDPKPTDVNLLVAGMADLVSRTAGPSVAISVVPGSDLWPALIDPNQLEGALLNLCINARDAMPDGGRLTIETANHTFDATDAEARELPPGQYVSLCVSDTGTGMSPDVIERAFDPFFTTKPTGMGTGLGLSMIYGFAKQSGGQVRITSEVGRGAAVCLYLPRHLGDLQHAGGEDVAADMQRARQGETVLIVDDEPAVRQLVVELLHDLGYVALQAEDGPSGLRILESGQRIDLLVSDVGLPGGMNGRQLADAARMLRPLLPVLFITGYAETILLATGDLAPNMHVLAKPFPLDELARRIRTLTVGEGAD